MQNGRIIGLISGKGGVGKTTLTVNMGIALQKMGKEVTIVDADFSASNLGVYLGRYDHPVKLQDVLDGNAEAESAVFRHPSGIKAITSSNEIDKVEPDTETLEYVLEKAAQESDYVLVDCAPGLNRMVSDTIDACEELMIVTMPTQTAGINAAQIIEKCKELEQPILGTVINKVENKPHKELIKREVEMMTESNILSQIPYETEMKESLFENTPMINFNKYSPASIELHKLAASLEGKDYKPPNFLKIKRGLNKMRKKIAR